MWYPTIGPRVVGIDGHVSLERAAAIPRESLKESWQQLRTQVGQVTPSEAAGIESLQVYTAMKEIVAELGLSAVAAGCYPHRMGKICLSASLLGEQGIPIACEGDINGAVGMLVLNRLTEQPVHNADLLDPIPSENVIVFSHCGSGGLSLAASPCGCAFAPTNKQILEWTSCEGLGHHWMGAHGDLRPSLAALATLTGIEWFNMD